MVKTLDNKLIKEAKNKPRGIIKKLKNLEKNVIPAHYICFSEPDNKEATNSEVTVTQEGGIIGTLEEVTTYFNPMIPGANFYNRK